MNLIKTDFFSIESDTCVCMPEFSYSTSINKCSFMQNQFSRVIGVTDGADVRCFDVCYPYKIFSPLADIDTSMTRNLYFEYRPKDALQAIEEGYGHFISNDAFPLSFSLVYILDEQEKAQKLREFTLELWKDVEFKYCLEIINYSIGGMLLYGLNGQQLHLDTMNEEPLFETEEHVWKTARSFINRANTLINEYPVLAKPAEDVPDNVHKELVMSLQNENAFVLKAINYMTINGKYDIFDNGQSVRVRQVPLLQESQM